MAVIATYLVVATLALYPFLPGSSEIEPGPFLAVLAISVFAGHGAGHLPWVRLFASGWGDRVRYVWSGLYVVLITVLLLLDGGGGSPLFALYALTTVYAAAVYPLRGQLGVLGFTFACYVPVAVGTGVEVGVIAVQLGILGSLQVLAGFLSHELGAVMAKHDEARKEADRRAGVLATLARASAQFNVLEPERVLTAVVDAVPALGFDASDLCVLDPDGRSYEVVEARGLPVDYSRERHPADCGVVGRVIRSRRTIVVADYANLPDGVASIRGEGYRAVMATPVWVRGRIAAVLGAGNRTADEVRSEQIEAIEFLAAQAGRALENAQRYADERRMVEQLEELDRIKADFLSTASHELRTPLTVVVGMSQILTTRWDALDTANRSDLLGRLYANAESLGRIVDSLLDFSRLERQVEFTIEEIDLGRCVDDAVARLTPLFAERELTADIVRGIRVRADEAMLERAIENLVANAAVHTPTGTHVHVTLSGDCDTARFAVEDDGPGIAAEDVEHLGERFYRGGDPNARKTRGLGLGLALVREVLSHHGSALEITSVPGEGARFSFELSVSAIDGVPDATAERDRAAPGSQHAGSQLASSPVSTRGS